MTPIAAVTGPHFGDSKKTKTQPKRRNRHTQLDKHLQRLATHAETNGTNVCNPNIPHWSKIITVPAAHGQPHDVRLFHTPADSRGPETIIVKTITRWNDTGATVTSTPLPLVPGAVNYAMFERAKNGNFFFTGGRAAKGDDPNHTLVTPKTHGVYNQLRQLLNPFKVELPLPAHDIAEPHRTADVPKEFAA